MNAIDFSFSDLITGYVIDVDREAESFRMATSDGREYRVELTPELFAELIRNLGEPFQNATGQIREMLEPGRFLFVYGIFFPGEETTHFEAKHIVFAGRDAANYRFESSDWWVTQIRQLADFYIKSEFGDGPIDFRSYRTNLDDDGLKLHSGRQETDTISRLVYGFASAYMLTGDERYLDVAERGTEYLRDNFRFEDRSQGIVYWYHAIDVQNGGKIRKIFSSEFGDDYHAIPCYEQIYALAGPVQTYRVTGDPRILADAEGTVQLFRRFFRDQSEAGGYFSHIDPVTFSPLSESLGQNRARKNWNSNGDHAPAYLINLLLATGDPKYAAFLEETMDVITAHFQDYDESPFVQERFHRDWSKDQSWGWQQNRAVVGHNLKIAWNLMRVHSIRPKDAYLAFARKIAEVMPTAGMDRQRGGWYDVVERQLRPGQTTHRFAFHDRKAWWQQEQAILAYKILAGTLKEPDYLRLARESAAFYNAWFLDNDGGGIHFNVLANGQPYELGTERDKGSHSMSGYHSFELAYLAAVYTNLLINRQELDLHFKPQPGAWPNNVLRVAPDLLAPGRVRLSQVFIDDKPHKDFDAEALTITLPESDHPLRVRAVVAAADLGFSVEVLDATNGTARVSLAGRLDHASVPVLAEQLDDLISGKAKAVEFQADRLDAITPEAIRFLQLRGQTVGDDFSFRIVNAKDDVKQIIRDSSAERTLFTD